MLNYMRKLSESDYIALSSGLFFVDRYGFDLGIGIKTLFELNMVLKLRILVFTVLMVLDIPPALSQV